VCKEVESAARHRPADTLDETLLRQVRAPARRAAPGHATRAIIWLARARCRTGRDRFPSPAARCDATMNTTPDTPTPRALRELTPLEARILGVLVEKQHTVPDTYPLSLNALTAGCNQKTARSPVMNVSEDEVTTALDGLKHLSIVMEGSSSRVPRFEHNMNRVLGIPSQAIALLTILLLRGPQTAAELRLNSARLHGFADISSVEAFLDELAARAQPLVVRLPRAPGARENRWMHLMCGEVNMADFASADAGGADSVPPSEFEALKAEQKRLADEVARLNALVLRMAGELGIDVDAQGDAG